MRDIKKREGWLFSFICFHSSFGTVVLSEFKPPITLALSGTSAQQLDASFNTTAALEIFEMDFADPSLEMKLRGTLATSNRSVEHFVCVGLA